MKDFEKLLAKLSGKELRLMNEALAEIEHNQLHKSPLPLQGRDDLKFVVGHYRIFLQRTHGKFEVVDIRRRNEKTYKK